MLQNNEPSSENQNERVTTGNSFYQRYPESDSVPGSTTANGSTIHSEINTGQNENIVRNNTQEAHLINFIEQGINNLRLNDPNGDGSNSQINELNRNMNNLQINESIGNSNSPQTNEPNGNLNIPQANELGGNTNIPQANELPEINSQLNNNQQNFETEIDLESYYEMNNTNPQIYPMDIEEGSHQNINSENNEVHHSPIFSEIIGQSSTYDNTNLIPIQPFEKNQNFQSSLNHNFEQISPDDDKISFEDLIIPQSNHITNQNINNNQDINEPQTIIAEENYEYGGNNAIGSDLVYNNFGIIENYDTREATEDNLNS
jgi:hypothetical protein